VQATEGRPPANRPYWDRRTARCGARLLVCALPAVLLSWHAAAQDLEPRAYSLSPVGTNFIVASYGYSTGDISFDPSVPVEEASADLNAAGVGYFRSVSFFGRSANVTLVAPYVWGTLEGLVAGEFTKIRRSGFADPKMRVGINLYGGPAMNLRELASWRQATTIGASLSVLTPLGEYDHTKVVNLGGNRWSFKPEIGLSHRVGPRWVFDLYGGVWLFTDNDDFRGSTREQDPIWNAQLHVSYNIRPRLWAAFDANFYEGGRTTVDGVENPDLQRNSRVGVTFSAPLSRRQSFKFTYSRGAYTTIGADFDAFAVAYQYLWGGGL